MRAADEMNYDFQALALESRGMGEVSHQTPQCKCLVQVELLCFYLIFIFSVKFVPIHSAQGKLRIEVCFNDNRFYFFAIMNDNVTSCLSLFSSCLQKSFGSLMNWRRMDGKECY